MSENGKSGETPPETRQWTLLTGLRRALPFLAGASIVSLVLEFGFHEPPIPLGFLVAVQAMVVASYLLMRGCELAAATDKGRALRDMWLDLALAAIAASVLLYGIEVFSVRVLRASAVYVAVLQGVIIAKLLIEVTRLNLALSRSTLPPARLMVLTFGGLIVIGTLALALPRCTTAGLHADPSYSILHHVLNCAFTAVSATCVTGLAVFDTAVDFTLPGQIVILLLIQLGGLGIMIFGSVLGLLLHRQLSLRQSLMMQDTLSQRTLGTMRRMILFIVALTLTAEALGAVALYPMWADVPSSGMRVFYSVFHSVSAFCNAGFSLQSDSLIKYSTRWQVYCSIMPLIVLGGLGFTVLDDLWKASLATLGRMYARLRGPRPGIEMPRKHRLTLHTKIVLTISVVLVALPTLCFVVFESGQGGGDAGSSAMRDASLAKRAIDGLFFSVTCRTAGFNTIAMDTNALSPASHFLACVLMLVGGSPASTAGGIKTVAVAVLLMGVWSMIRGRENVEAFGRTIPLAVVRRAAVVAIAMLCVVALLTLVLAFTESASLKEVMFETVSACGTVGLSTGLTPDLTVVGRLVIMVAMFAGRLGPLTLLIALAGERKQARYEYPEEHVGIG